MNKKIILIDGSSFIFRAFYAMPPLSAPDGTPTGATYGVINMIKQMLKQYYDVVYWACVFDTKAPTFRKELYPEYKANRIKAPDDLVVQIPTIHQMIQSLGIKTIMKDGFEADDIIATIATHAAKLDYKILIATGDKDFAALVNNNITLINTMTDEHLDVDGVIKKFGVSPSQIIDYLTLVGDKADNVPGVNKCGPKTAVKWLTEFKNLENLIANSEQITGVVGKNLRESIDWLKIAQQLISIDTNVALDNLISGVTTDFANNLITALRISQPDTDKLQELYTQLNFNNWLKQLKQTTPHSNLITNHDDTITTENKEPEHVKVATTLSINNTNYNKIYANTIDDINKIIHKITLLAELNIIIIIIPSSIPKDKQSDNIDFILINAEKNNYILELKNLLCASNKADDNVLDLNINNNREVLSLVNTLFHSNNPKILLHYKETAKLLQKFDIKINNVIADLNIIHYLNNSRHTQNLTEIFQQYYNITLTLEKKQKKTDIQNIDTPNDNNKITNINNQLEQYLLILNNIMQLEQHLYNKLSTKQQIIYKQIELPLVQILIDMESAGIKIDINKFNKLHLELSAKLTHLEHKIYHLSDTVFNINSNKQLQDILFKQLNLPTNNIKKNQSGYSTDEESLKILAKQNIEIASLLLEYRTINKLLNTYIDKLPKLVDKDDRIHTNFDQTTVTSGRLSSYNPNLQNIPIKNNYGKEIRRSFIAQKNHVLVCSDYSQIELRILAYLSQDENLLNAFKQQQDIHLATASWIFNKPINEIDTEERRRAKAINFSLLYGKTAYGLSNELNIDIKTAKNYIDTYFNKFPKVLNCLEKIKNDARDNAYVETIFGRKIYLPNILHKNVIIRQQEERLALNSPMQGSSADIIKIAMKQVSAWIIKNNLSSKLILQIHDELIIEVPNAELKIVSDNLNSLMTKSDDFKLINDLNLSINTNISDNWHEARL